jgi:hypothetical protein
VLTSTLKIKDAEVLDTAFYECEAIGGTGGGGGGGSETQQRLKSMAILTIVHDAGSSISTF